MKLMAIERMGLAPVFTLTLLLLNSLLSSNAALAAPQQLARDAQEVLSQRCMVCHGCYDAPCQLKLEAHEGLRRGGSKARVYDGARLVSAQMTRLFDDGFSDADWRERGFYPVLDDKKPEAGVMYRMLALKQDHPLPSHGPVPEGFDFSLGRKNQQCPKPEEFDAFARDYPLWGMPYGLPGLDKQEHKTLTDWLTLGAPEPLQQHLPDTVVRAAQNWEEFLNGSSNKERLMSRYLYEHLFLANLYFEQADDIAWFRLVRSHTPPGKPLSLIRSRRPYDDPGTEVFYYRLQRMPITILDKRHMPYRFDDARLQWYKKLFLEADYKVAKLPSYKTEVAANPFRSFRAIPVQSRYEFLLHEAQFSIMNFIKGPVCRGQIALNVIDDHFWVMFSDPAHIDAEDDAEFLAAETDNLRIPTGVTGTPVDLFAWRRYARSHKRYLAAKSAHIEKRLAGDSVKLNLEHIWDGDGNNDNAALTVFRHFDTASVVRGFVGDTPKTAWVIGYSLLERIHYLLVAAFDVYGGVSHQLESRLYMDFLRMEGESNFLMFLPRETRKTELDYWYRGAREAIKDQFFVDKEVFTRESDIVYSTDDPKTEFLQSLRRRLYGAQAAPYDSRLDSAPVTATTLGALESAVGTHNSLMPHVSFINVIGAKVDQSFTLIRNSGYSNIAQLFKEQERRLPAEDTLTVVRGFIGAYPNSFFQVNEKELPAFASEVRSLESQEDFNRLLERYGVHRNAPWFWRLSDKFHRQYQALRPVESGLFDYNRYHHR